jgi:hypothetical protein
MRGAGRSPDLKARLKIFLALCVCVFFLLLAERYLYVIVTSFLYNGRKRIIGYSPLLLIRWGR